MSAGSGASPGRRIAHARTPADRGAACAAWGVIAPAPARGIALQEGSRRIALAASRRTPRAPGAGTQPEPARATLRRRVRRRRLWRGRTIAEAEPEPHDQTDKRNEPEADRPGAFRLLSCRVVDLHENLHAPGLARPAEHGNVFFLTNGIYFPMVLPSSATAGEGLGAGDGPIDRIRLHGPGKTFQACSIDLPVPHPRPLPRHMSWEGRRAGEQDRGPMARTTPSPLRRRPDRTPLRAIGPRSRPKG